MCIKCSVSKLEQAEEKFSVFADMVSLALPLVWLINFLGVVSTPLVMVFIDKQLINSTAPHQPGQSAFLVWVLIRCIMMPPCTVP